MKRIMAYTTALLLCTLPAFASAQEIEENNVTPIRTVEDLQADFLQLKFGMFIHFNMATYQGVEWVSGYPSPAEFDPGVETIDTDAWAEAAVSAGMTYAVLSVKHVGGFCLWDSKYTTYDVMHPDCPYQKDLVAQFVKSFTERGLKVGFYYCWRHPGFGDPNKHKVLPPECDPAEHDLDAQIAFQKQQIAELVEMYPDVFYIWNDALDPQIMSAEDAKLFFRNLSADVIACGNWWDWGKKGSPYLDLIVTETRHVRERQKAYRYVPAETCWKLERKWFASGGPTQSPKTIVSHIITANNRRANFLLNVGPGRDGRINPKSIETLAEIGKIWIPIRRVLHGE